MKSTRISYFPQEDRRDRRYPLPALVISVDGIEYETINWSLGGFLIAGFHRRIATGETIAGTLRPAGRPEALEFTASVVRSGEGQLAAKFTDLGELGMTMLERIITRRLFRS